MFEKEEIYEIAPLFGLLGWMLFTQSYVAVYYPEWEQPFGWIGFILILSMTALVDVVYWKITGPYPFIDAVCSSFPNSTLRFYVEAFEQLDQPTDKGHCSTTVKCRWPIKHPEKGKCSHTTIHHVGLLADNVDFAPGRAQFQGEWFGHPSTAKIWLEELKFEGTDIEKAAPIPIFSLRMGNKKEEESSTNLLLNFIKEHKHKDVVKDVTEEENPNSNPGFSSVHVDFDTEKIMRENLRLKRGNRELTRRYMKEHMNRIAIEEAIDLIKNELGATLNIPTKQSASVWRQILAMWEAFGGIDQLVKLYPRQRMTASKWAVIGVLGIAGLVYLTFNPDLIDKILSWTSTGYNGFIALGLVAVMVVTAFLYRRSK